MIRIRAITAFIVAITALAGLSACSSSGTGGGTGSASAPPTASSVSSSATTDAGVEPPPSTTSTAAGNTNSSGGSSSGGALLMPCAESKLQANVASDDIKGLARHVVKVSFTNKSAVPCTLSGFPGAAIVDASGKQVLQAKRIVGGPVGGTVENSAGPVTVAAGATAYAYLEGSSTLEQGTSQADCDQGADYPRILVTPPDTSTPVPFTIGWPQCYSFDIHPVRIDN